MENHMVYVAILLVRKEGYFEYFYWFSIPFINKKLRNQTSMKVKQYLFHKIIKNPDSMWQDEL